MVLGLGLSGALLLIAFLATGGIDLAPNTWVQAALTLAGAAAVIAVMLLSAPGKVWGAVALLLFGALTALTYASIAWSAQPATSWLEANRTLSYLAAFGIALALARLAPGRWRGLIGAVALAATVISAYALLVKVFPGTFDPYQPYARLQAPFGYWNATGLMAAMGIPACLWAGARRDHAPVLRALSAPAIAILVPALLLAESRGALVAAVIACGCWFGLVPLRLRAALILAVGTAGGAAIAAWGLATHSISADHVVLAARTSAGHAFGVVLLVVLALTAAAGFAAAFATDRLTLPSPVRHRLGTVLVGLVALIPVGGVVALAASSRGLTGEISHVWTALTSPSGLVKESPGRLVQLSNSRPNYWSAGMTIAEQHLLAGVGALGFQTVYRRYSPVSQPVNAHSYAIETFADFGLVGLSVSAALLVAWALAARRSIAPQWRGWRPVSLRGPPEGASEEWIGLVTAFAVVLTFGVHSLVDWTWFIPGTAIAALVCAGWLAGRGPLSAPVGRAAQRRSLSRAPWAIVALATVAVITVVAVWVIVQPLRSSDASGSAITALTRGDSAAALTDARAAAASDPVSVDPLFLLSAIYTGRGNGPAARGELLKAVRLQPANPESWYQLGSYDLAAHRTRIAQGELRYALFLEPASPEAQVKYAAATAALSAPAPKK
jgi:cytochrome c-type biogenesis protein CcmH/NrfG